MFPGNGFLFQCLWIINAVPIAEAWETDAAYISISGNEAANKNIYILFLLNPPSTNILLAPVPFMTNCVDFFCWMVELIFSYNCEHFNQSLANLDSIFNNFR